MVRMTIELPEAIESGLRKKADREGKSAEQMASDLVGLAIRVEMFDQACAEPRATFAALGMTEDEFMQQYLRQEHASRGIPYDDD